MGKLRWYAQLPEDLGVTYPLPLIHILAFRHPYAPYYASCVRNRTIRKAGPLRENNQPVFPHDDVVRAHVCFTNAQQLPSLAHELHVDA